MPKYRPLLPVDQILAWADAHRQRTGAWPTALSGPVEGAPGETWYNVNAALNAGLRGLPRGGSLCRLLDRFRGVRPFARRLPDLSEARILAWADAHHARTGAWPRATSGPCPEAGGQTWGAIDSALRGGGRGLPGGRSLTALLLRGRGVPKGAGRPRLSEALVLRWAKAHRRRTGRWPTSADGPVLDAPGEWWVNLDHSLQRGHRGLRGGQSVSKLLARRLGVRNLNGKPRLAEDVILRWADAHHKHTGAWPTWRAGAVTDEPGETWARVHWALRGGFRGLPGGSSLVALLAERRGVRPYRG